MADDPTIDELPGQQGSSKKFPEPESTIATGSLREAAEAEPLGTIDQPGASLDAGAGPSQDGSQTIGFAPAATEPHTGVWIPDRTGIDDFSADVGQHTDGTIDQVDSQEVRAKLADGKKTPEAQPGAQAGRFVLKKFHARGGMGEVWIAEDSSIGRVVALKKIRGGHENKLDSFLHEAQITGQLEHPGVVPVHELGTDPEGHPYYIMKFVHGRTLKEAIDEYYTPKTPSPIPKEVQLLRLLQVFINLCQTVAYAHSRNVIHRDLKPDNVMVGEYGETLVLDWGLAKVVGEGGGTELMPEVRVSGSGDTEGTQFGSIKGTPSYMSPEVAEGRTDDVDQISDVYLLGGCLYQILTGKRPRHSPKVMEMVDLARKHLPLAPRVRDRTVPKQLDAICMKTLAMKKEDRYQSALALAEEVQRYIAGEPVEAYRENFLERAGRWIRKHRVGLTRAAVVAVVVAGVAVAGGLLWQAELQRQEDLKQAEDKRKADIAVVEAKRIADQEKADREKKAEQEKTAAAQALADKQAREQRAQEDLKKFRQLAEEMQFFNVMYDNAADREPLYGTGNAEARGKTALAALQEWGPELERYPFPKEAGGVRKELYEVLLNLAQLLVLGDNKPETAKEAAVLLDRAEKLQPPTAGYYRLRARVHRAVNEAAQAADAQQKAAHTQTPVNAVDHYLLANQQLAEALTASDGDDPANPGAARVKFCAAAIESYYKAIQIDAEYYWAYWQMGRCFNLLGKTAESAQAMASCTALRPVSPCGFTIRGLAFFTVNRKDEALANLDRALAQAPDFRPARLHRGQVHWLQKEYQKAEDDFEAVLAPPEDARLLPAAYYRGQMHQEKKEWKQALADYDLVIAAHHPLRDVHLKHAQVCFQLDLADEGLKSIDTYLRFGRDKELAEAEAFELRGRQLHLFAKETTGPVREKQLKRALAELQKAVQKQRQSATLFAELGAVQERLARMGKGKFEDAIASYTDALKYNPADVKTLVNRGWARDFLKNPDHEAARADFAEAVRLDPSNAEAHSGLGYFSACCKVPEEALRHANQAILYGSGDYIILHNVACTYAQLSTLDKDRRDMYEDLAIDQLTHGVKLWQRTRLGPSPIGMMQRESAFTKSMKARPGFKKLLAEK